jgi:hypothetical protein
MISPRFRVFGQADRQDTTSGLRVLNVTNSDIALSILISNVDMVESNSRKLSWSRCGESL